MASNRGISPYLLYLLPAAVAVGIGAYQMNSAGYNWLVAWLVTVNIVTFVYFAWDKLIAGSRLLRVPEIVLHGLALVGGSPLALVAQAMFGHKTAKGSFQLVYWGIVVLQVGLLAWYHSQ